MSENTYLNIYRTPDSRDSGYFDLVAMEHETETDALEGASPVMYDGSVLVAVAVPVIIDPERAKQRLAEYAEAKAKGAILG
jgi:hypothetical protein